MTKHLVPASHHQTQKLRAEANAVFPELSFVKSIPLCQIPALHQEDWAERSSNGSPAISRFQYLKDRKTSSAGQVGDQRDQFQFQSGSLLVPYSPYVIMTFDTNRTKSIVTISCSVLLFGFFLGAIVRSKSSEIFIATATYAAVLVVFVGTGNG